MKPRRYQIWLTAFGNYEVMRKGWIFWRSLGICARIEHAKAEIKEHQQRDARRGSNRVVFDTHHTEAE